jgi:hypothetical protein
MWWMYKHLKTQSYYEGVDFHELYRGTSHLAFVVVVSGKI